MSVDYCLIIVGCFFVQGAKVMVPRKEKRLKKIFCLLLYGESNKKQVDENLGICCFCDAGQESRGHKVLIYVHV